MDEGPIETVARWSQSDGPRISPAHRKPRAMSLTAITRFAVLASIMMLVFALGLRCPAGSAGYLFRKPSLLARGEFQLLAREKGRHGRDR